MGFASHTSDPPDAHSKGVSELLAYYVAFPVIGGLVSSVLSVVVPGKIENSTSGGAVSSLGFVSFVSPVSGHAQNFRVRSEHDEDLQDALPCTVRRRDLGV